MSDSENPAFPTPEEILDTHEQIEEDYDMKYTGAKVAAPRLELRRLLREGDDVEGLYSRAAFLLRKLITAHVFEDGNKRTAWVTTREFLLDHGEEPPDRGPNVPRVLRKIRRYDVEEIAEWLETGEIDEDRLEP